jgi:hypothetical protein
MKYKNKQTGQIVLAEKVTADTKVQVAGGMMKVPKDTWHIKPTDGSYFIGNVYGISDKSFREQYEEIKEEPKVVQKVTEEINPFEV